VAGAWDAVRELARALATLARPMREEPCEIGPIMPSETARPSAPVAPVDCLDHHRREARVGQVAPAAVGARREDQAPEGPADLQRAQDSHISRNGSSATFHQGRCRVSHHPVDGR
jgi:hypothetical protein